MVDTKSQSKEYCGSNEDATRHMPGRHQAYITIHPGAADDANKDRQMNAPCMRYKNFGLACQENLGHNTFLFPVYLYVGALIDDRLQL